MAILSSLAIPLPPKFQVKLFQCQPCQFHRCSEIYLPRQTFHTRTTSIKSSVADHNEPSSNEVKMQIGIMKDKLREAVPISVQEFPWRKSQHILIDRLLLFMQEALKWSLISYFIFSSLSDVLYTISINRELLIPVGLFVGCLLADFLKEISQELIHHSEEQDLKLSSLGLCCIFVVKFMSTWFASQPRVFLLHVANGGLMQVLWYYWRNFMKDSQNRKEESTASGFWVGGINEMHGGVLSFISSS